jgi:hypothetical protein
MPTAEPDPYKKKYPNTHNPYAERPPFHKYDTRHKRRAYNLSNTRLPRYDDIEKQARLERKTARAAKKGRGGTRRRHRKHRSTRRR